MLFPLPKRDPRAPVDGRHLRTIAECAVFIVQTIRDYLPIEGETEAKAHWLTIDQWFSDVGGAYQRIERLRNPEELPWPGPRGSFSVDGPETAWGDYRELCYALEPLCEHYGWQGISDGSRMAHSDVRSGGTIPPIPERILKAIETPARRLRAATQDYVPWGSEVDSGPDQSQQGVAMNVPVNNNPEGIDTTPTLPRPPAQFVDAAARDIPVILADVPPRHDNEIELIASHLAKRLQDAGHTLQAAHWAIHEAGRNGHLRPGRIETDLPSFGRVVGGTMRSLGGPDDRRMEWTGGERVTVGIPKGKPAPFDCFKVTATESLWEWWRSLPTIEPNESKPKQDTARTATPPIASTKPDAHVTTPNVTPVPAESKRTVRDRPGRRKASYETTQQEAALAAEWQRAKENGTYKPVFAREKGLKATELDTILDRVAKRKKRSDN